MKAFGALEAEYELSREGIGSRWDTWLLSPGTNSLPGIACAQKYTFIIPAKKFSLYKSPHYACGKQTPHDSTPAQRNRVSFVVELSLAGPHWHIFCDHHVHSSPCPGSSARICRHRTPNLGCRNRLQAFMNHFLSHPTSEAFPLDVENSWLLSHTPRGAEKLQFLFLTPLTGFLSLAFTPRGGRIAARLAITRIQRHWWFTGLLSSWIIFTWFWGVLLLL